MAMISTDILTKADVVLKKFAVGEVIFEEGGSCQYYHQLHKGRVRWVNIHEDGKEYLQMMVEPGETFGEFPLFDGGVYAASAIAETESEIYRLPKESFHLLLRAQPEIHFAFSELLVHRLRFKFMIINEFAHQDPIHRIESLLNYIKNTSTNFCRENSQVKLTRQQIADMTGLRVETVIRAMRQMNEAGKIQILKGRVYLYDMTAVINE